MPNASAEASALDNPVVPSAEFVDHVCEAVFTSCALTAEAFFRRNCARFSTVTSTLIMVHVLVLKSERLAAVHL